MASKFLLIALFLLVSFSVTSGFSLFQRDAVSEQDEESYVTAPSDQGSSMVDVEDLAKSRSLQVLVDGSTVYFIPPPPPITSASTTYTYKRAGGKYGRLNAAGLSGIVVAAIVGTVIILYILYRLYDRYRTKRAQTKWETLPKPEDHVPKPEDHV